MVKVKRYVFTAKWLETILRMFGTTPFDGKIKTIVYDPIKGILDVLVESSMFDEEVSEGAEPEIKDFFFSFS